MFMKSLCLQLIHPPHHLWGVTQGLDFIYLRSLVICNMLIHLGSTITFAAVLFVWDWKLYGNVHASCDKWIVLYLCWWPCLCRFKVKKETLKTCGLIKFNEKRDHKSDGQLAYFFQSIFICVIYNLMFTMSTTCMDLQSPLSTRIATVEWTD